MSGHESDTFRVTITSIWNDEWHWADVDVTDVDKIWSLLGTPDVTDLVETTERRHGDVTE